MCMCPCPCQGMRAEPKPMWCVWCVRQASPCWGRTGHQMYVVHVLEQAHKKPNSASTQECISPVECCGGLQCGLAVGYTLQTCKAILACDASRRWGYLERLVLSWSRHALSFGWVLLSAKRFCLRGSLNLRCIPCTVVFCNTSRLRHAGVSHTIAPDTLLAWHSGLLGWVYIEKWLHMLN